MDTFLFFEPQGRRWTPRREIGTFGPVQVWDPWSAFGEIDGPVWRPCAHGQGVRPQQCLRAQPQKEESKKPEGFHLTLDAAGYRPEEVSVKLSDNVVTVRAHHREKTGGGLISSSLVRRVRLPEHVDASALTSRLTRSGQLVLEAPPAGAPALELSEGDKKPSVTAAAASGEGSTEEKQPEAAEVGEAKADAAKTAKYQVSVNVSDFKPEEVTVKVDGGVVIVDAVHEETSDEGCSSSRLLRKFALPRHVNPDHVTSRLTQAGQLMVEAPVTAALQPPKEGAVETEGAQPAALQ
ncbi:uncharacterized protein LOC119101780 [Pollicipes pollicipes]|uniref:uncharacterized protein LOC119101780 n=1 Tax=Pollicipes pollicipes TaxID=41117 RepID=UPI001884C332|nr:uncharacterized protein LOC119101780 [Pollicipes pollicipes]